MNVITPPHPTPPHPVNPMNDIKTCKTLVRFSTRRLKHPPFLDDFPNGKPYPMTDPWCWFINANMTGVYWWDPWHTIYGSTMDPSWV